MNLPGETVGAWAVWAAESGDLGLGLTGELLFGVSVGFHCLF